MKRKRYSVEQVVAAVKEHETGAKVPDVYRRLGIAEATFYRWKQRYGGLEPDEVRELRQLREENAKLKRLVADLSLDKVMLQDITSKKVVGVSGRKTVARYLITHYSVSERRACRVLKLARKTYRYVSQRPEQAALRKRIVELAESRLRYGYKRIHVLLKREGIHVNKKRVHRLYCLEGLQLRPRRPRRSVSAARRQPPKVKPTSPNQAWSMDFVSDQLSNGQRFRALTIIDVFTRQSLSITPGKHLKSEDVVQTLRRIVKQRGLPKRIYCDNGSEFSGKMLDLWAYTNQVILEFSRPGKPTDNAFIESFNGSLRDECLNAHWFTDLMDAKQKLLAWQIEYNEIRPHKALINISPNEFAAHWAQDNQNFAMPVV